MNVNRSDSDGDDDDDHHRHLRWRCLQFVCVCVCVCDGGIVCFRFQTTGRQQQQLKAAVSWLDGFRFQAAFLRHHQWGSNSNNNRIQLGPPIFFGCLAVTTTLWLPCRYLPTNVWMYVCLFACRTLKNLWLNFLVSLGWAHCWCSYFVFVFFFCCLFGQIK